MKKSVKPEHFSENNLKDPEIHNLINKIKLEQLPGVKRELLCAKLQVTMKNGDQYENLTESPKGEPVGNPLSKDEIVDKFFSNLEYSQKIDRAKGEKLLSLLDKLEELENINKIIDLLI